MQFHIPQLSVQGLIRACAGPRHAKVCFFFTLDFLPLREMPNGDRAHYRCYDRPSNSPSPAHTSDSEGTDEHKQLYSYYPRYRLLASRVIGRWRQFVRRRKERKLANAIRVALGEKLGSHTNIPLVIAQYHKFASARIIFRG